MIASALPATSVASTPEANDPQHAKLRQVAHEMEGMFLRQLFSAMRANATVGGASSVDGSGAGGQMFTSMLDDALADKAAERTQRGLGDALYHQLSNRLAEMAEQNAAAATAATESSKVGA